jgi:hypothetical protein
LRRLEAEIADADDVHDVSLSCGARVLLLPMQRSERQHAAVHDDVGACEI